ncbi:MAG: hypothetical protein AVO38_13540 [delta proteobacterium ML8_D]|jgi:hypothetical protein|nr:MAG: hypothetical protein AVO38_13540 [delta proteobacterium ML8_D]
MTERNSSPDQNIKSKDLESLWEFVPLADYHIPSLPARSAAATSWTSLKRIFRRVNEESRAAVKEEAKLRLFTQARLKYLVQPLNLTEAARALDSSLNEWMMAFTPDRSVKLVIGQPHGSHAEIVRQWGLRYRATPITPPTYKQIFTRDLHWFDSWPESDLPWVLPNLERCYLRHTSGLTLLRELFERSENGRLGRGLIGCDSWGWAYLQRVWPVPRPDALTLQAFDGQRLARLLTHLVVLRSNRRICFRNAKTGNDILTIPATNSAVPEEIVELAAHSRGNVGIAILYWRNSLRTEPDMEETNSDADKRMSEQGETEEERVWVSAKLSEPVLPIEADEDTALVLHALLLHGGMPASLLPELLPLSQYRCMAILLRLRNAGVVEWGQGCWWVAGLAYENVRSFLRGHDYLADGF